MTRKALCISFGAVLIFAFVVFAPAVRADDLDQASQFTFNQPVQLPGNLVLPSGTYWFVIADEGMSPPTTVQVFNQDRTHILAAFETITTLRSEKTDSGELTFAEQPRKQPVALVSWFYPGRLTGREFVYSPREQESLAKNQHITVIAQDTE